MVGTAKSKFAVPVMESFVWTKMGVESGEGLAQIVRRKEAERIAGGGAFWWGIGNSLGPAVRKEALAHGGALPVLFSTMLGRAKPVDSSPDLVWKWTKWEDEKGRLHDIPAHVKVISRGQISKKNTTRWCVFQMCRLALRAAECGSTQIYPVRSQEKYQGPRR
jgi:hypothetical protein